MTAGNFYLLFLDILIVQRQHQQSIEGGAVLEKDGWRAVHLWTARDRRQQGQHVGGNSR